jgi:AcrR family transcriptional regulator
LRSTRDQLLDAAALLIVEKGFPRATTKEIARNAGVAEGTLYKHFEGKADLFQCVMRERITGFIALMQELPARAGTKTVEGNLTELVTEAVSFFDKTVPLMTALAADRELFDLKSDAMRERGMGPVASLRGLREYLRLERDLGRVRADAPIEVAAQALLGACHNYALVHYLFGDDARLARQSEFVAGLIDIVMSGISPDGKEGG